MFSYNTSIHEGHGYTPFELIYGKKARLPTEIDLNIPIKTHGDYLGDLIKQINDIQANAAERLKTAKEKSKLLYDLKLQNRTFNVGDMVYLLKEPVLGKFSDQWIGPREITKIINHLDCKLKIEGNKKKIVNLNKLKHANSR